MSAPRELSLLLDRAQAYVSQRYSAALNDSNKHIQLRSYLEKFLRDNEPTLDETQRRHMVDHLYTEMAEYSVLTQYLGHPDIEEININAWDDIAITYTDGRVVKAPQHFTSPTHASDIIKRLLHSSGMIIDETTPMAQGHLPGNTRITALKTPLVDDEVGTSASIRLLHPATIDISQIVYRDTATQKMVDFLCMCLRYGVSFVIAGATGSGKTTMLNALLSTIPSTKRVFTIESGSRELDLVRQDEYGNTVNNVVHTLSRPSSDEDSDISQEKLVVASLRFNPDIVVVGEMRDIEAYAAVEASLTGHTVVSTIHAYAASEAHMRLAMLCQKRFTVDIRVALMQAAQAFPLVIYAHKLEDNSRRLMDISECVVTQNGDREYHTLFRYIITKNEVVDGKYHIEGHFIQPEKPSNSLRNRLLQFGVPLDDLEKFLKEGAEY